MDYIFKEKEQFIEAMEKALLLDKYNGVESCKYYKRENWEFIRIDYKGGYTVDINTSANSNGANRSSFRKDRHILHIPVPGKGDDVPSSDRRRKDGYRLYPGDQRSLQGASPAYETGRRQAA